MTTMKSMALDDEDAYDYAMPITSDERPEFPWELRITLTDKTMKKLGLDPSVALGGIGDTVMIHAMARITSASIDQREGQDEPCARVELQIESMALGDDPSSEPKKKRTFADIYAAST